MTCTSFALIGAGSEIQGNAGLELLTLSSRDIVALLVGEVEGVSQILSWSRIFVGGDSRPVKSSFRAMGSGPRGSDLLLRSTEPLSQMVRSSFLVMEDPYLCGS